VASKTSIAETPAARDLRLRTKSREAGTTKWTARAARSAHCSTEHQAEWILAIGMHGVGDAARFQTRATHVLQAQSSDFIERIVPCCHASRNQDHRISPAIMVSRDSSRQPACACNLDRLLRPSLERGAAGIGQCVDAALDAVEPAIDVVQQDFRGVRNRGFEVAYLAGAAR
jgi:hypothetical protein